MSASASGRQIASVVFLIGLAVLIALALLFAGRHEEMHHAPYDAPKCRNNLKQIGMLAALYALEHGQYPPAGGSAEFFAAFEDENHDVLRCPADSTTVPPSPSNTSYAARAQPYAPGSKAQVMAADDSSQYHGGVRYAVWMDLTVLSAGMGREEARRAGISLDEGVGVRTHGADRDQMVDAVLGK